MTWISRKSTTSVADLTALFEEKDIKVHHLKQVGVRESNVSPGHSKFRVRPPVENLNRFSQPADMGSWRDLKPAGTTKMTKVSQFKPVKNPSSEMKHCRLAVDKLSGDKFRNIRKVFEKTTDKSQNLKNSLNVQTRVAQSHSSPNIFSTLEIHGDEVGNNKIVTTGNHDNLDRHASLGAENKSCGGRMFGNEKVISLNRASVLEDDTSEKQQSLNKDDKMTILNHNTSNIMKTPNYENVITDVSDEGKLVVVVNSGKTCLDNSDRYNDVMLIENQKMGTDQLNSTSQSSLLNKSSHCLSDEDFVGKCSSKKRLPDVFGPVLADVIADQALALEKCSSRFVGDAVKNQGGELWKKQSNTEWLPGEDKELCPYDDIDHYEFIEPYAVRFKEDWLECKTGHSELGAQQKELHEPKPLAKCLVLPPENPNVKSPVTLRIYKTVEDELSDTEAAESPPPPIPSRTVGMVAAKPPPLPPRKVIKNVTLDTVVPKQGSALFVYSEDSENYDVDNRNVERPGGYFLMQNTSASNDDAQNIPCKNKGALIPPLPTKMKRASQEQHCSALPSSPEYIDMSPDISSDSSSEEEEEEEESEPASQKDCLRDPFPGLMDCTEMNDEKLYGISRKRYNSTFSTEPLYQVYRNSTESSRDSWFEQSRNAKDHIYCEILEYSGAAEGDYKQMEDSGVGSTFCNYGNKLQTMWQNMKEVVESGVLETLSVQEKGLQQALFEVMTSEASYLKSLNILINIFLLAPEFSVNQRKGSVVTKQEQHELFSNIGAVREVSERFLADLEAEWQRSIIMENFPDIIMKHATGGFSVYVCYCTNQVYQNRVFESLRNKPNFEEAVLRLQKNPACQGLSMHSFLLLPMQRITRMPLLVNAIYHRLDAQSNKYKLALKVLNMLKKTLEMCNEGARQMEQTEKLIQVARLIIFRKKKIPLISASRHLVKRGQLTEIVSDIGSKSRTFFTKLRPSKQTVHLFLFNDLLLITKKKSNQYQVIDHCIRRKLISKPIDDVESNRYHLPLGVPSSCKNLFMLAMLENSDQKQAELILSCSSQSDRSRWLEALTAVTVTDSEKIYADWDCPQVQALKSYEAQEQDELSFDKMDIITVLRKVDGEWYFGELLHDRQKGWFPASYTEEIVSERTHARNMRLRYQFESSA